MIIKGFSITAGQRHAAHLLRTDENEHVFVHEVSGFVASDLHGAFKESESIARGTTCQQHLFSCAFAPPESASLCFPYGCAILAMADRFFNAFGGRRPPPPDPVYTPRREVDWLKVYEEKFGPYRADDEVEEDENPRPFDPKRFH